MADQKQDKEFVVSDRRKFTAEGELRTDVRPEPASAAAAEKPADQAVEKGPAEGAPAATGSPSPGAVPPPPSTAEQQAQHAAYRESGKQFEPSALGGRTPKDFEMTFERLVASLYMTAMMQLGLMQEEGRQPYADLLGAKQTIDTLGVIQDKTKGNLSESEQHLLQNCLYELRMAFVELTNALARGPEGGAAFPGEAK